MGILKRFLYRLKGAIISQPYGSYDAPWDLFPQSGKARPENFTSLVRAFDHWASRCITLIAENMAEVPLRLYVRKESGGDKLFQTRALDSAQRKNLAGYLAKGMEIEEVTDPEHPFLMLMEQVNPHMNQADLVIRTVQHEELVGNAYWRLISDKKLGIPLEIWPLQPDRIRINVDEKTGRWSFEYQEGMDRRIYSWEEVVHFLYPSPDNMIYGKGTLARAVDAYNIDTAMRDFIKAVFLNSAMLSGVFTFDQPLNDVDYKNSKERLLSLYAGIRNAGRVGVMDRGVKFQPISQGPKDLEYIGGGSYMRDTIAGIFGVPKSFLTTDDVNRANAEAGLYQLMRFTILPKLRLIEQKLNERVLPLYDKRLFVRFDNPVPEDNEYLLKERASHISIGLTTINEEREKLGLEPVPWGDEPPNRIPPLEKPDEGSKMIFERSIEVVRKDSPWYAFEKKVSRATEDIRTASETLFRGLYAEVLANLDHPRMLVRAKEIEVDDLLFDKAKWEDRFEDALMPLDQGLYLKGGSDIWDDAGVGMSFDLKNDLAREFFRVKAPKIRGITDTDWKMLRKSLGEGIEEGENLAQLKKRVRTVYAFAMDERAETIAWTESVGAYNGGQFDAVVRVEDRFRTKKWLTVPDGRERPSHAALNGVEMVILQPFPNGLMYAGDPTGEAKEIIRCRCTVIYLPGDEE